MTQAKKNIKSKTKQGQLKTPQDQSKKLIRILVITVVAIIVLVVLDTIVSAFMRPIVVEREDNTRKADIINTVTELMDGFLKKNKGQFPSGGTDGAAYTRPDFTDPDGTQYAVVIDEMLTGETKEAKTFNHTVYVYTHATCHGGIAKYSNNPRRYAILYHLASGESFCYKDNEGQNEESVVFDNDIEIRNKQTDSTGKTTIAAFLQQDCEFRYDYQFDNSARLMSGGKYYDSFVDMSKKYNIVKGETLYPSYGAAACDTKITGKYNTKDVVRMEVQDGATNAFTDTIDEQTGEFSIKQAYYIKPDLIGAPTGESQIFKVLFIDKYDNIVTQVTFLYNVEFSDENKNFINEWRQRIDNQ